MTLTATSPNTCTVEFALSTPKLSSTGKTMLVATDRAKAFITLPDGSRREITVQLSAYYKA